MTRYVGMTSGGLGSWAACKLTAERFGTSNLSLVFADTLMESDGCYRFLCHGAGNIFGIEWPKPLTALLESIPPLDRMPERKEHLGRLRSNAMRLIPGLVWLADGRHVWEVYRAERFIGNSRVDPCSKILKRELMDRWCNENCTRPTTLRVVGLGWWERERFYGQPGNPKKAGLKARMAEKGWTFDAPLIDAKLSKYEIATWAGHEGLDVSDSYEDGFEHDNCSGFCCKAGHAHFRRLLHQRRDVFLWNERQEQESRRSIGRDDITVLTERRDGKKLPLTMAEFRMREEAGESISLFGGEGCGCFAGSEE